MFHESKIFRVKYLISKFPYSAQMQKKRTRKTLNTDTIYAMFNTGDKCL